MPIPLDVLQSWSKSGKNEMSKQTYYALKDVLSKKLEEYEPIIYLQGSYSNSTNVRDNSDIDIVLEFSSNYDPKHLKNDVLNIIQNTSGFQFTTGSKTIKFNGIKNRYVPADIVPCTSVKNDPLCIRLYDSSSNRYITNYPKLHIQNGKSKSRDTDGNFKKAVRIMKNAKNYLESIEIPTPVSSYVIECALYNVPNELFLGNESNILHNVTNWFIHNQHMLKFMTTQDEKCHLFQNTKNSPGAFIQLIGNINILQNKWGKL